MARNFLAMNGKKINTLDDLRSNFNGKQTLAFYRTGRLQKWLEELGESDLLETLRDFQNEDYDDETLLSMLMAAFELDDATIAKVTETVKQETKANLEPEEKSIEPEEPEISETSSIYTETDLKFIELKNKVYAEIKELVKDSVRLTAEQRTIEPQWTKTFCELYGISFYDLISKHSYSTGGCLDCLQYISISDCDTPLGVLETVLSYNLKECVEEHYAEPAKLHVRYMELLDK